MGFEQITGPNLLAQISSTVANATTIVTGIVNGYGLTESASTGSVTLAASLTATTVSLGADVPLNSTTTYFDGPSVAQGSTGVWFASGTVTLVDTAASVFFNVKLWDGSTVIASGRTASVALNNQITVSLSGFITSPAGNLRMSCEDITAATGKILFNASGNSKDSTITAIRIA